MSMRTVLTESSLWIFDEENQLYIRMARDEAPRSTVKYTVGWEPYLALVEPGEYHEELINEFDNRIYVIRPVQHGTGRHRRTGEIEYDSAKDSV